MCRNIKTLFNFDPPATSEEINAAALQFLRKFSGFQKPSQVNEQAFTSAVEEVEAVTKKLLKSLKTDAKPKDREEEHRKAHARALKRFG